MTSHIDTMTPTERRSVLLLAGIFSLRMLGLFMILPVFALYAEHLPGSTPALAGLAIGLYGASQAVLQIPFGMLSDRWGRKQVIVLGLLIFAVGSIIAAVATDMTGVLIGRVVQGAGAVSAAAMALAADLTREEHRTKAMSIIGVSIGVSFVASMVLGPWLNGWIGVPGIFWVTALLALGGIAVVLLLVPTPPPARLRRDAEADPALLRRVLTDPDLLRLDAGILILHMLLTATFVALPLALRDAGIPSGQHGWVYLPALVLALAAMVPFVIVAERRRRLKPVFLGAILGLGACELGLLAAHDDIWMVGVLLFGYFTAFNLLEATLPSLIAKMAPPEAKGTAMGVYSSCQFVGAFLGGSIGGLLHGRFGIDGVFAFTVFGALLWYGLALGMRNPRYLSTMLVKVEVTDAPAAERMAHRLAAVAGVAEAVVLVEDGVAYLKVDRHALDEDGLRATVAST